MPTIPEHIRAYIYRVVLAALPILTALGVLSEHDAPLVLGLVAAILGQGLATANTDGEHPRFWFYRVVLAALPILVAAGFLAESDLPLYVALIGAVLGTGVATVTTSAEPAPPAV